MQVTNNNSLIEQNTLVPSVSLGEDFNYDVILRAHNVGFKEVEYYLQVGELVVDQGWILHISVLWTQYEEFLEQALPMLISEKCTFRIVKSRILAEIISGGNLGNQETGKLMKVYPENDAKAVRIAQIMISLTREIQGADVVTDVHLGGGVFTRYGSYGTIKFKDETGRVENYIKNGLGDFVKDVYSIPFVIRKETPWPFQSIVNYNAASAPANLLKNSYIIRSVMSQGIKGRVLKSWRLNGFRLQTCVIKEGKRGIWLDQFNRDIRDRLRWQFEIQKELESVVPVPKPFELFFENGNSYLVMEYIRGKALRDVLSCICNNRTWLDLDKMEKVEVLDLLLNVINVIQKLHDHNIIHRDITPVNFLLTPDRGLCMIDLELSYSMDRNYPDPPFKIGSPGFVSPEQIKMSRPNFTEDIYSLGALMIYCFINVNPSKFLNDVNNPVDKRVYFFVKDYEISKLIADCIANDPSLRPDVSFVRTAISAYKDRVINSVPSHKQDVNTYDAESLKKLIQASLLGMNSSLFRKQDKVWRSSFVSDNSILNALRMDFDVSLFGGLAGIMCVISTAKRLGFEVAGVRESYVSSFDFIKNNHLNDLTNSVPGLFAGSAGVAMCISDGIVSGMLGDSEINRKYINDSLSIPSIGFDLANGLAGQGVAIIYSLRHLDVEFARRVLKGYVNQLIQRQQKNGTWVFKDQGDAIENLTLSSGVSGVIYFISEYLKRFEDPEAYRCGERAINFLLEEVKRSSFRVALKGRGINLSHSLFNGLEGIAFSLAKASDVYKGIHIKPVVEKLLLTESHYPSLRNLGLFNGSVGVELAYLEISKVWPNDIFNVQIHRMIHMLMCIGNRSSDGSIAWQTDETTVPSLSLFNGNCGVLYFLMACYEGCTKAVDNKRDIEV